MRKEEENVENEMKWRMVDNKILKRMRKCPNVSIRPFCYLVFFFLF
jgi:hypothetical protein